MITPFKTPLIRFSATFILLSLLVTIYTAIKSYELTKRMEQGTKMFGLQKSGLKYVKLAIVLTSFMFAQSIVIITLGLLEGTDGEY